MTSVRVIGAPADVDEVVAVLRDRLAVTAVSGPYPARGGAGRVRVYVTVLTRGEAR